MWAGSRPKENPGPRIEATDRLAEALALACGLDHRIAARVPVHPQRTAPPRGDRLRETVLATVARGTVPQEVT